MKILVLSPHTDDAELGCGGSLTKWMEKHEVTVIAFSPCVESIPDGWDKSSTKDEFTISMNTLGCIYELLDFPVRNFNRQEVLDMLLRLNRKYKPNLVVGTCQNDIHQDHKVISDEMLRAFRCSIIGYETPYNNLTFDPTYYERLTKAQIENKCRLVQCYHSQIVKNKDNFSDEFIFGLAKVRGMQIKNEYAEAFECYRYVC